MAEEVLVTSDGVGELEEATCQKKDGYELTVDVLVDTILEFRRSSSWRRLLLDDADDGDGVR